MAKRSRLANEFIGSFAYCLSVIFLKTLRLKIEYDKGYCRDQQYLFAFWHGKQWLPIFALRSHDTQMAALVSSSKDGDLLEVWLKKIGYEVIRGSSRHRNVSALSSMIRKLKIGRSIGFGIDGPIGPIYKVKPGMTHMSRKLNIPIVPIGSAFSNKWVLEKAWDRYEIPKPFSKAAFYLGQPLYISEQDDLELMNQHLEERIQLAELKALALLQ